MIIAAWIATVLLATLVVLFAWWRFQFFHRNPPRTAPPGTDLVCPADGRIIYIDEIDLQSGASEVNTDPERGVTDAYHRRVQSAFALEGRWSVIATYLGIFDVHVVRAPIAGRVRLRHIDPLETNTSMGGSFIYAALRRPLPIGRRGYTQKNEFLGVEISGQIRIVLVLMADWWIDQIVTLVDDGAEVERGQAIGRIQMGSQVDLWAAAGDLVPLRGLGERVQAGSVAIARAVLTSSAL